MHSSIIALSKYLLDFPKTRNGGYSYTCAIGLLKITVSVTQSYWQ